MPGSYPGRRRFESVQSHFLASGRPEVTTPPQAVLPFVVLCVRRVARSVFRPTVPLSGAIVTTSVVNGPRPRRRSLRNSVWESLVLRVPRAHEIAGSNPATLTASFARSCAGTGR